MALTPEDEHRLDDAAARARIEFEEHWQSWSVKDVAFWWRKWCTMHGTNHDLLGKILMDVTGVKSRGGVVRRLLPPE